MRKLTFKGFLAKYVKELSYAGTADLSTLAREAIKDNPRLRAPLLLYAVTHGKADLLRSSLIKSNYNGNLLDLLQTLEASDVEDALEAGLLPRDYLKAWNSYKVMRDKPQNNDHLKAAMRDRIRQLQKDKGCSNYRIYKDLKLNPGNINSWLKDGDCTKVSYNTAKQIMDYVMQYQ